MGRYMERKKKGGGVERQGGNVGKLRNNKRTEGVMEVGGRGEASREKWEGGQWLS